VSLVARKAEDVIFGGIVIDHDFNVTSPLGKGILDAEDGLGAGEPDAIKDDLGHT
jgi:hypothetical protein